MTVEERGGATRHKGRAPTKLRARGGRQQQNSPDLLSPTPQQNCRRLASSHDPLSLQYPLAHEHKRSHPGHEHKRKHA